MTETVVANEGTSGRPPAASILRSSSVLLVYLLLSAGLIRFNKFLMGKDRFPFPMALTLLHMTTSFFICMVLYACQPSLFPGVRTTEGRRLELSRWFLPLGIFFSVSLYTSNRAYVYADVAFLQFMKEANVAIAFSLSCLVGVQVMDRVKAAVVCWVVVSSACAVAGEAHFMWIGFILQAVSQVAECARLVMGECVLTGAGLRLDALSYTLFTAPVCMVVLTVGTFVTWDHNTVTQAVANWHFLVPNAMLAFGMNFMSATAIKEISAVGCSMAGVLKHVLLVFVSVIFFGEVVTLKQYFGFSCAIFGIVTWSLLKVMPDCLLVTSLYSAFRVDRPCVAASNPIVAKGPREHDS